MHAVVPYIILGLATGSAYSIAALGLVVTYKTAGIFNFGHGAVAAIGAYAFYALRIQARLPWPIAIIAAVIAVGVVGGLLMEGLARRLANVDITLQVVATVGLFIAVEAVAVLTYGPTPRYVAQFLPTRSFLIVGARISVGQIILFLLAAGTATGLAAFLRRTRLGMAMRGVVDDPALVELNAISPAATRRWAWVIGCAFAALSGTLLVPSLGLDASLLTLLVVQAFGAAAIGAFSSLPLTYVGGLVVGVGASVLTKFVSSTPQLAGLPPSLPFIVLFVALLVVPKRKLQIAAPIRRPAQGGLELPAVVRGAGGLAAVGLLVLVPFIFPTRELSWTNALALSVVFLSLNLLVRTSGQVSLCHAAFAAVGAATFANLSHGPRLPWLIAVVVAGLVAIPVGAIVAIPAVRLSGVFLAVATFGFGLLVQQLFYGTSFLFGHIGSRVASRPAGFSSDRSYYYLVLLFALGAWGLTVLLRKARLGRLLSALAGSPTALETGGTDTTVTRLLVFGISAFMAGIAGALLASGAGTISSVGFNSFQSLTWLAVLVLAGRGQFLSAVLAGIALSVIPSYITDPTAQSYLPLAFGLSAIAIAAMRGSATSAGRKHSGAATGRTARTPVKARSWTATAPFEPAATPVGVGL